MGRKTGNIVSVGSAKTPDADLITELASCSPVQARWEARRPDYHHRNPNVNGSRSVLGS